MINISVMVLTFVLMVVILLFSMSMLFVENNSNEMSETAFECGFEPFFFPRIPFSIHFFTVTVVFLVFDLEVIILMPILFKLKSFCYLMEMTVMIWVLLLGLLIEWFDSSISWQF